MEPTGINRGRSILRPIGDVLPDELTPHEAAWISKALELDFPGRNAIVEQLSHAKVARKTDDASDDIRFDAIDGTSRIESSDFFVLGLKVLRRRGPYASSELLAKNGKLDSFYIYMPDNSHLDLACIPLDDAEHDIPHFRKEAKARVEAVFRNSKADSLESFESLLLAQAESVSDAVSESLKDVARALGGTVCDGLGPLCTSIRVPLGKDGSDEYEAVAQCSLVGSFFIAYPMRNGFESPFPGYGGKLAQIWNYPGGELFGLLRARLYELGYKPLTPLAVHGTMVKLKTEEVAKTARRLEFGPSVHRFEKRLLDCYFSGLGLAG